MSTQSDQSGTAKQEPIESDLLISAVLISLIWAGYVATFVVLSPFAATLIWAGLFVAFRALLALISGSNVQAHSAESTQNLWGTIIFSGALQAILADLIISIVYLIHSGQTAQPGQWNANVYVESTELKWGNHLRLALFVGLAMFLPFCRKIASSAFEDPASLKPTRIKRIATMAFSIFVMSAMSYCLQINYKNNPISGWFVAQFAGITFVAAVILEWIPDSIGPWLGQIYQYGRSALAQPSPANKAFAESSNATLIGTTLICISGVAMFTSAFVFADAKFRILALLSAGMVLATGLTIAKTIATAPDVEKYIVLRSKAVTITVLLLITNALFAIAGAKYASQFSELRELERGLSRIAHAGSTYFRMSVCLAAIALSAPIFSLINGGNRSLTQNCIFYSSFIAAPITATIATLLSQLSSGPFEATVFAFGTLIVTAIGGMIFSLVAHVSCFDRPLARSRHDYFLNWGIAALVIITFPIAIIGAIIAGIGGALSSSSGGFAGSADAGSAEYEGYSSASYDSWSNNRDSGSSPPSSSSSEPARLCDGGGLG
jgi:hypothetical protein